MCAGLHVENLDIDAKDLTIVAVDGDGSVTVNGSGSGTVVSITESNVTLEGLVITNGSAAFPVGAGIDAVIGSLVIDGCTVASNLGRGISAANSITSIFDSTIQQNQAAFFGGGVAASGLLQIYDSQVLNNSASTGGGGIYATSSGVYVENTTVAGNSVLAATASTAGGGGILLNDSQLFAVNSSITSNSTAGSAGGGVGVITSGIGTLFDYYVHAEGCDWGDAANDNQPDDYALPTTLRCMGVPSVVEYSFSSSPTTNPECVAF